PEHRAEILGIPAFDEGLRRLPRSADVLVADAPAGVKGSALSQMASRVQTILVPILPSPIDMQATKRFLAELHGTPAVSKKKAKVGIVANRVRDNTLISGQLDEFIEDQKAPYVTWLREAQNYVRAYIRGLGVHELPEYRAWAEWQQWEPLITWLDSRASKGKG
ncbi:MAG: chromosome partitioning protein, partial [Myxococcota bacterium]